MPSPIIEPIPAFVDNYIWCLHDRQQAVVVDPGDPAVVASFIRHHGLALTGILVTHHHWDHINGITALLAQWPGIPVWGPAHETIPGRTVALDHGDTLRLPLGMDLQVLAVPGHTLGQIAYFCPQFGSLGPVLFCGDSLFSSGCGRLFEGTAEQMYTSLRLLAGLPPTTRMYCTHEYTLSNLKFALAVEPDSKPILARMADVEALRARGEPSLPSSIGLELEVNPFLRTASPGVIAAVSENCGIVPACEVDTFAKLRSWKDHF